jgi:hypothetical protein
LTKQEKAKKAEMKKGRDKSEKLQEKIKSRNARYEQQDDEEEKEQMLGKRKRKDDVETVELEDLKAKFGLKNPVIKF